MFTGDPAKFTRNKGSKWVTIVAILLSLSPSFSISNLPCRIQGANICKGLTTAVSLWFCWSPHDQLSPQVGYWTNCSCLVLTRFRHALSSRGLQGMTQKDVSTILRPHDNISHSMSGFCYILQFCTVQYTTASIQNTEAKLVG